MLIQYPLFDRKCNSLRKNLLTDRSSGIIAEFKRKSPSLGKINTTVTVEEATRGYVKAGVAGLSVLTDFNYFGGTLDDLLKAREANPEIPILCKDFMIDSFQIREAKAYGADVILLIASCLEYRQAEDMAREAKRLGMEVLMEIHDARELEKVIPVVDFVGVNNRDLKSFQVDIETSEKLSTLIPESYIKISESGISNPETIRHLKKIGFNGFLIGENFMKASSPAEACKKFISEL